MWKAQIYSTQQAKVDMRGIDIRHNGEQPSPAGVGTVTVIGVPRTLNHWWVLVEIKIFRERYYMPAQEIKECPFCGGKALLVSNKDSDYNLYKPVHYAYVKCTRCMGNVSNYCAPNAEEIAIEAWNVRAGN
jgi:Lar family restriction alleviation protein